MLMEDDNDLAIRGDEYVLTVKSLKGSYSHLLTINCEDGTASATLTDKEAARLARYLLQTIRIGANRDEKD